MHRLLAKINLCISIFFLCIFVFPQTSFAAVTYVRSFTHGTQPSGVTILNDTLYVTDNLSDSLYTFTLNGAFITSYTGYPSPMGLTLFNNKLYSSNDATGTVQETVPGDPPTTFATGLVSPWGVSAYNSHLYIVDTLRDEIVEYDQAGVNTRTLVGFSLNDPASIAFDTNGNAYVTNFNSGTIIKIDADFNSHSTWVSGLGNPFGIAIDQYNTVYVSDNTDNVIYKYDSSGNLIDTIGSSGSDPGEFSAPLGVYVDNAGNIFVADSGNGRVQQFVDTDFPQPTPTPTPTQTPSPSQKSSPLPSSTDTPVCGDIAPFYAPELFQINVTNTTATLYFSPVLGANKYYIGYGLGASAMQFGVEYETGPVYGVTSYTINNLVPNTAYTFIVRGGNGCMPGGWGNTMTVKTNNSLLQKSFYKLR